MKKIYAATIILALLVPVVALAHGNGHAMGTIDRFENDTLTVTSTDGEELSIQLTSETKIVKGKSKGSRSDIEIGSRVVVHYAKDKSAAEIHLPAGE